MELHRFKFHQQMDHLSPMLSQKLVQQYQMLLVALEVLLEILGAVQPTVFNQFLSIEIQT